MATRWMGAVAGVALAALAGGQARAGDMDDDWHGQGSGWHHGWSDRDRDGDRDDRSERLRDRRDERRGGRDGRGMMGGMMGMHGAMGGGARFMLRAGDARMAVQCSPNESMRACVDAATQLMDRAQRMAPSGGSPGAPTEQPGGSTGSGTRP